MEEPKVWHKMMKPESIKLNKNEFCVGDESILRSKFIVGLIGTFNRYGELKRCLSCVHEQSYPLNVVLVLDNAADEKIKELVNSYGRQYVYLPMLENRGCGAALKVGELYALREFEKKLTHFWVLDDDAAPLPNTLQELIQSLEETDNALIAPLCTCPDGSLFALPDSVEKLPRGIKKKFKFPYEVSRYYGDRLVPIRWCVGVSYLVKAEAVKRSGTHRDDFWMCGDDIEFSMRICLADGGVLAPSIITPHLYPESRSSQEAIRNNCIKFCSLLQNLTYLAVHSMRNRYSLYYMVADYVRFFRTFGWNRRTIVYSVIAFWNGAILSEAAGHTSGKRLRERVNKDLS